MSALSSAALSSAVRSPAALPSLACLAVALGLGAAPATADEDLFYLLSAQSLGCLKDHAADYAPEGGRTSFITVADCGTAKAGGGSLLDQVMNSAPDISAPDVPIGEEGPDAIVALTAADFACLATLAIPAGADLVAFYPEDCNVEPR